MTPAKTQRIVTAWQKRLKMEHINVELDFNEEPEDDSALATVSPSSLYDYAKIRFSDEWLKECDVEDANRVIVHELLHVLFRDHDNVFDLAMRPHSYDARSILTENMRVASEGLIDRMAHRLVELGGVVK